ncbi:DUF4190 domain-containing protein [Streptomyces sp. NPDC090046]|uniref:DUF4190 domain-containing protein n=1 Tax=Streptomyces sp. NPDC090046 TaxID=3365928 RepID=UPI00381E1928
MSTPPTPPSTPAGPPTEPEGTPIPETDSIPAPAQPLSLQKTPAAPEAAAAPGTPAVAEPEPAQPLSLDKTPAAPEAPAAPAAAETPEASAAPAAPAETPAAPAPAPWAFAPPGAGTTPAPAAAPAAPAATGFAHPGAPAAPGAPGNAWGEPAPGFAGAQYPAYPAYPQDTAPSNGLAVASLITGGFGIILGIIPLLFWMGAITAAVGVGLGIAAIGRANKGAPNKTMAVVGTVLSVLGLLASVGGFFLTAMVFDRADRGFDRHIEEEMDLDGLHPSGEPWPSGYPSPSKSPSPSQVPGLTSALPFGETFTYPNGIKVSLSVPTKFEPKDKYSRERIKNAVQMTVTITNGTSTPHEVIYAMPNVRDDKGMTAEMVFDGGSVPKMIRGSIMPGESASGLVAFEVPEGTKSLTADISAGTMLDDVKYAGPIG